MTDPRTVPFASFKLQQQKAARKVAQACCIPAEDVRYVSGVSLERGGRRAIVGFMLTREALVIDLDTLATSLHGLDRFPAAMRGLLEVSVAPTAFPHIVVVEDAHPGGGGMDPASSAVLVDMRTRKRLLSLWDSEYRERPVVWQLSPDRRRLAAVWYDGARIVLRVYDAKTGKLQRALPLPKDDAFYDQRAVAVNDSGDLVAFADDRGARVFDLRTGEPLASAPNVKATALALPGALVISSDREPLVVDARSGKRLHTLKGCGGRMVDVFRGDVAWVEVEARAAVHVATTADGRVRTTPLVGTFGKHARAAHDLESGRTVIATDDALTIF